MNQSHLDTISANNTTGADVEEPAYVMTAVGVGYITTGVIIIPLHIICSLLMWKDKGMRNPTYQFIINLSIADVLELIPLGFYDGICVLMRLRPNELHPYFHRLMAFWVLSAGYANAVLFVFIAFSRWIAMTRNHLVPVIFTRRNLYFMHIVPWVIIVLFYAYALLIHPVQSFSFFPQLFTWGFDLTRPFGTDLLWFNFSFNLLCSFIEMGFNILSLRWVHQTRKTIQNPPMAKSRRREVKLLIQCCIMGTVFTLASIMFTIVFEADLSTPMYCLGMQIVWTSNHCVNPLVYLGVNSKLRAKFVRLITCGKFGQYGTGKVQSIPAATPSPSVKETEEGDASPAQYRRSSTRRNSKDERSPSMKRRI